MTQLWYRILSRRNKCIGGENSWRLHAVHSVLGMDQLNTTPSGPTMSPKAVNVFLPVIIPILTSAERKVLGLIGWLPSTVEVVKESQLVSP